MKTKAIGILTIQHIDDNPDLLREHTEPCHAGIIWSVHLDAKLDVEFRLRQG